MIRQAIARAVERWRERQMRPACDGCYQHGIVVAHAEQDGNEHADRGDTYLAMQSYAEANAEREAWWEHRQTAHPTDASASPSPDAAA